MSRTHERRIFLINRSSLIATSQHDVMSRRSVFLFSSPSLLAKLRTAVLSLAKLPFRLAGFSLQPTTQLYGAMLATPPATATMRAQIKGQRAQCGIRRVNYNVKSVIRSSPDASYLAETARGPSRRHRMNFSRQNVCREFPRRFYNYRLYQTTKIK